MGFTQYPHTLTVKVPNTEPYQDENNEWVFGTTTEVEYKCRAQANSNDKTLTTADGQKVIYNYLVLCPKIAAVYPPETEVTINRGFETVSYKIKRYHNTQLNTKIWI